MCRWTSLTSFTKFVSLCSRLFFFCWNMLSLKCGWVWILLVWTCALNRSRQRLSGEKGNFNENECNMWIQVSHWSIRASELIQHLNLPPPLLTRPHQCQPLLSFLSSILLLCSKAFSHSVKPASLSPTHWFWLSKKKNQLYYEWTGEQKILCHSPSSTWKVFNIISLVSTV